MEIRMLRSYANAKAVLDNAQNEAQAKRAPAWGRAKVMEVEAELFARRRAE